MKTWPGSNFRLHIQQTTTDVRLWSDGHAPLSRESYGEASLNSGTMAKNSGRPALPVSDVAAPINVVRDGSSADRRHARGAPLTRSRHDADAHLMHEVSEDLRAALVPDRIGEAVAHQLEASAGKRVRAVLRQRLANELRALLRKHARQGFVDVDPTEVLNDGLADALTEGTAEALAEQFPSALRERLPVAIRAATANGAFAKRAGKAGIEDLADRLGAMTEMAIRQRLHASLRSVVRARLGDVARHDAGELLRIGSSPEDGGVSAADQIAAIADAIENATHDAVVQGIVGRFRVLVVASLHQATGDRLDDGLRRTLALSAMTGGSGKSVERVPGPRIRLDGLGERLQSRVADAIKTRLMEGLRERIETTCRENIDAVLQDRLAGAIRLAIAEQHGSENIDLARLGEMIHYELAEILRARLCDGIRARTA